MAEAEKALIRAGLAAAMAATTAFMAALGGGSAPQPAAALPAPRPSGDDGQEPSSEEKAAEKVGELIGRALRTLGARGEVVRERAEGFYGMYRLLRALGMTDQEIAALVAGQARQRIERGLKDRTPTAADTRRLLDGLQETVVRAAAAVDERLDLGGDFVRPVREAAQATRPGREDAILAVERGVAAAREQVRKLLNEQGEG